MSGRTSPAALNSNQIAYLAEQPLCRLATIDPHGAPQVNPVHGYYNPTTGTIDIGGFRMASSRKYRNVQHNPKVALVVDQMPGGIDSIRCLEVRGLAETIDQPTDSAARAPGAIIRVTPHRIISWGS